MEPSINRGLETLAVAAHGGSLAIHSLGVVYHCVTAKRFDKWAAMHAAVALVSGVSIAVHALRLTHTSTHRGDTHAHVAAE